MRTRIHVVAATLLLLGSAPAFAEMKNAKTTEDTRVLREPREGSEVLGKFRAGTALRVFVPARKGWYATYFKTPVKGTNYGWMPESAIALSEGPASTASPAASEHPRSATTKHASNTGPAETTLGFFAGMGLVGDGVGAKPLFGADLNFPVSSNLLLGGNLGYVKTSAASDELSASSWLATAEALYYFTQAGSGIYAGLKAGAAMTQVSGSMVIDGVEYDITGSDMSMLVVPGLGYDFGGQGSRWFAEGNYYLPVSGTGSSIISLTFGLKLGL